MIIATLIFRSMYKPCIKDSWKEEMTIPGTNCSLPRMGWDGWMSTCRCSSGATRGIFCIMIIPCIIRLAKETENSCIFSALALWLYAAYACSIPSAYIFGPISAHLLFCLCCYKLVTTTISLSLTSTPWAYQYGASYSWTSRGTSEKSHKQGHRLSYRASMVTFPYLR